MFHWLPLGLWEERYIGGNMIFWYLLDFYCCFKRREWPLSENIVSTGNSSGILLPLPPFLDSDQPHYTPHFREFQLDFPNWFSRFLSPGWPWKYSPGTTRPGSSTGSGWQRVEWIGYGQHGICPTEWSNGAGTQPYMVPKLGSFAPRTFSLVP